jgi:hypothetical protein
MWRNTVAKKKKTICENIVTIHNIFFKKTTKQNRQRLF